MDDFRQTVENELKELTEKTDEEYEEFLKDVDRDSYYHAVNLIDEFSELDEEIYEEWKQDVEELDSPYRLFVLNRILNSHSEE